MQIHTGTNGLKGYGSPINTPTYPNGISAGSMAFNSALMLANNTKKVIGRFLSGDFIFASNNWTSAGNVYNDFKTNTTGKLQGSVNKGLGLVASLRLVNFGQADAKVNVYLMRASDGGDQTLVGINDASLNAKAAAASDRHRLIEKDFVLRAANSGMATKELRNIMMAGGDLLVIDGNSANVSAHWEAYDPSGFRDNLVVSGFGDSFVSNRQVGVVW